MLAARRTPLRAGPQTLMGAHGVAETALDPLGRVRVRGEAWSAESVGELGLLDEPVRVVAGFIRREQRGYFLRGERPS